MIVIIAAIFIVGYLFIALEHRLDVHKAATALVTGVLCWTALILTSDARVVTGQLAEHVSDISGVLFFLLGAMAIVELIDAHSGFGIITRYIRATRRRWLLWIIALAAFFLSAVLDNLTTTIVMISVLRKLVADEKDRFLYAGVVVIAANAGGAWSPIGDITTTMLWIGGQITPVGIMARTLVPSLVCLVVSVLLISIKMSGKVRRPDAQPPTAKTPISVAHQAAMLGAGILALLMVPVFKAVTHLPPYMGMLAALGALWVVTEWAHHKKSEEERHSYSVAAALKRIDISVILFFLGILLSVGALQAAGILDHLGGWLAAHVANANVVVLAIGLLSSIVDNVPLVAATQGMYSLAQHPADAPFWQLIAYCAGTGGSILVIGSAAGVAAMSMEKLEFFSYLRKIGWIALAGYFAGALTLIFMRPL